MEKQTVTIDGKEYVLDDLSDLQKYMLEQLLDLQKSIQKTKMRLDQYKIANAEFSKTLSQSFKLDEQGDTDEAK